MAQSGSLLTAKEGPNQSGTRDCRALGDDCTMTDGAARFGQRVAENGQENDRCNDTLESKEILNLNAVSEGHMTKGVQDWTLV